MARLLALPVLFLLSACSGASTNRLVYTFHDRALDVDRVHYSCMDATGTMPVCEVATITNDPKDSEFWQFEARVPTGYGGRMPVDQGVVGTREQCEAVRAKVATANPTEPGQGPYYYRLNSPAK